MNKKTKILISGLSTLGGLLIIIPTIVGITQCSKSQSQKIEKIISNKYDNKNIISNSDVGISNYFERIISTHQRTPNKKFYKTTLEQDVNFRYPGYNYNYKTLPANEKADLRRKVLDERTDFVINEKETNIKNKFAKYSDSRFIRNEILNKSLKVHPAVKSFYLNNVLDNTLSVKKEFSFNTSSWGTSSLGLYAPAGEIIKIVFDAETYNLIKERNWNEIYIDLNTNYWDCKEPNDDGGSVAKRYPYLQSSFRININEIDPITRSYEFGTPFGGSINIRFANKLMDENAIGLKVFKNINFTIENAVEQLHYAHGITTEDDWNRQIKKVISKEITSPMVSFNSNYFSFNMQFYDDANGRFLGENKSVNIKDISYPKEVMNKWDDFIFLSRYAHRNDKTSNFPKCDFKFAEELWGGGAGWGGGNILYCPPSWGVGSFFAGPDTIKASNWGMLHETNHNYQINEALFQRRTHGETNQLNMLDLAVLNDISRWRSPKDIGEGNKLENSGGAIYNNSYSTIQEIIRKYNKAKDQGPEAIHNETGEYLIYAMLIHKLGPYNYLDYIRWDQVNHPNTNANWDGFDEIRALSEFFKMNFFEAFFDYSKNWNEKGNKAWPTSFDKATKTQKDTILHYRKYPAFDFVGNMYSSGSYLYNGETNTYSYNGDYAPAYEIPAGKPYIFEFDNFINSPNFNFKWDDLKIESSSKLGAKIEIDTNNNKRLIYTPNISKLNEIDEFTISIKSTNHSKSIYYQPKYLWKIKVRQNAKGVLMSYYDDFESTVNKNYDNLFNVEWPKKEINPKYEWVGTAESTGNLWDTTNLKAGRLWFEFIAPEDGQYLFKAKWDDVMGLWINNKKIKVDRQANYQGSYKDIYNVNLRKGERINVKFVVINHAGPGGGDIKAFLQKDNNQIPINLVENTVIPYIDELNSYSIQDILHNPEFQYKRRRLDYSRLNLNSEWNNEAAFQTEFPIVSTNEYDFSYDKKQGEIYSDNNNPDDFRKINESLKDNIKREKYIEFWKNGTTEDINFTYDVNFKKPTKINSIYFTNTKKGWWWSTNPQKLVIKAIKKGDSENQVIYDGVYGDINSNFSIIDIPENEYTKLSITYTTFKDRQWKGITIGPISFVQAPRNATELGMSYNFSTNLINKSNGWILKNNDANENLSNIGAQYLLSKNKNNSLEFTLENSNGFRIIGQKSIQASLFDIYIDGKFIKTINTKSVDNKRHFNQNLFEYWNPKSKNIKVKIIHKDNNNLYLNYVSLYGSSSKIIW